MSDLYIPATPETPEVNFDFSSHKLSMVGEAYPENGVEFFSPIINMIQGYLGSLDGDTVEFNFKLTYFNSVCTKMLYKILALLNEYAKDHANGVLINWYHHEDDDMMIEFCDDIQEDFSWVEFNPVPL